MLKSKSKPITTPAPLPVGTRPQPAPSTLARVLGLDVAKYQDRLDAVEWRQLFARGYRFVFAKCTDGRAGVDSYYELHRRLAKQAGFLVGPYHFLRFGYDALEQARHFARTAGHVAGELPPVLDLEWDRYTLDGKYGEGKRMDRWAEEHAMKFVVEAERLFGMQLIIYTNAYFFPEKCSYPEFWAARRCWIPSYADSLNPGGKHLLEQLTVEELARAGAGVKVPSCWKAWNFWQDDDDLAIGDVKAIDTNVFRGSYEELRALVKR